MRNNIFIKFIIPICILLGAIFFGKYILSLKEEVAYSKQQKKEVFASIEKISPQPNIIKFKTYGTVEAKNQYSILPQVGGKIIQQFPDLQIGSFIGKGDLIFQIDQEEYLYKLGLEKANLGKAEFELEEEKARQIIAKREYEMLDEKYKEQDSNRDLALRVPQLKAKKLALESANSSYNLAQLNLLRTEIYAPCDGLIVQEEIEVGQIVNSGQVIASLACLEKYQIIANISQNQFRHLLPVMSSFNNARGYIDENEVLLSDILPNVDKQSKMVQVLIEIDNPLQKNPPILLGSFKEIIIEKKEKIPSYAIDEKHIHENNIIWFLDKNNKLDFEQINIISRQDGKVIFRKNENNKEINLITSFIANPHKGMTVNIN